MTAPPILNTDHEEMMAALGVYHLMTVEQMRRVGVADGSKRRVEAAATLLIRKHLVGRNEAKTLSPGDRIPAVHWLLPKGAAVDGTAKGAERRFRQSEQTRHRLAIVDVHISLQAWAHAAGAKVVRFLADFEPSGQRQRKPTSMSYGGHDFHPDALARVDLPDGSPVVFALEVERGGAREDRDPFRKGLPHWRGVAEDEVVEHWLGLDHPARFVIVFQSAEMRRKVLADWADPSAEVWGRFFCKGLDELGGDFSAGWWQPGRPAANLFQGGTPNIPRF